MPRLLRIDTPVYGLSVTGKNKLTENNTLHIRETLRPCGPGEGRRVIEEEWVASCQSKPSGMGSTRFEDSNPWTSSDGMFACGITHVRMVMRASLFIGFRKNGNVEQLR